MSESNECSAAIVFFYFLSSTQKIVRLPALPPYLKTTETGSRVASFTLLYKILIACGVRLQERFPAASWSDNIIFLAPSVPDQFWRHDGDTGNPIVAKGTPFDSCL